MDTPNLLDRGFTWTSERIAAVTPSDLGASTPCGRWTLEELLHHTIETLGAFTDAVGGPAPGAAPSAAGDARWTISIAELATRNRRGWADPAAMGRTYELPFGTMPGPVMASANLLELVVHGWDIGQATGEDAAIPDELAKPVLAFARSAVTDEGRGDAFAADLGLGDTPGEQLVAFLGRKPR